MVKPVASEAVRCYAMGDDLTRRPVGTAQFVAAAECEPDTPMQSFPENINARVSVAAETFSDDVSGILGMVRCRTPGNARNRNFVRRQLNGIGGDIATPQRIEALRKTFAADLTTVVENELTNLRRLSSSGRELVVCLELSQERYRLNPATQRVTPQPRRRPGLSVLTESCKQKLAK